MSVFTFISHIMILVSREEGGKGGGEMPPPGGWVGGSCPMPSASKQPPVNKLLSSVQKETKDASKIHTDGAFLRQQQG